MIENHIIMMLKANNKKSWEVIYDKYSAVVYGMVCRLVPDKTVAEKIFIDVFADMREKQILAKAERSMIPLIMRHACNFIIQQQKGYGLPVALPAQESENKVIGLFCTKLVSVKDAASFFLLTAEELKQRLRRELMALRPAAMRPARPENQSTAANSNMR